MRGLDYTGDELAKLKHKPISIRFQFVPNKFAWIKGVITEVYLASNPPHLPGSIDFSISLETKKMLADSKIEVPENIGIFDIEEINELS